MDYFDEPEAYNVTTSNEYRPPMIYPSSGGSSLVWIILLIIAFLAIAGLIVWVVLLYHRRNDNNNNNNPNSPNRRLLNITNPNIQVNSDNNSITGTWTSTSNSTDTVALYATTQPPIFASGTGATGGIITNADGRVTSQSVSNTTITLSGLQPATKYYATLVVTNPGLTNNYFSYTQLVFMNTTIPSTTNFAIEHILQVGKLQVINDTVQFSQSPTDVDALWRYTNGQLVNTNTSLCLFADTANNLGVTGCTITTDSNINSKWTYNPGALANRWCLTSTTNSTSIAPGATGARCMVLGNINTPSGAGASGIVTVSNTSQAGDAWVNAFENPPPAP
jgi:cytoskeletal protein RodZ